MYNIEKEYKKMISKEEYERMRREKWDNVLLQINYYYTNEMIYREGTTTLRIRQIEDMLALQIKRKN